MDEDAGAVDHGLEFRGCEVSEVFCDGGFDLMTGWGCFFV